MECSNCKVDTTTCDDCFWGRFSEEILNDLFNDEE